MQKYDTSLQQFWTCLDHTLNSGIFKVSFRTVNFLLSRCIAALWENDKGERKTGAQVFAKNLRKNILQNYSNGK